MSNHHDLTSEELRVRTDELLAAAERVSAELETQNQRLAEAIELFHRDVLLPLREGRQPNAAHSA
jgi:histidinol dehydrogenase